MKINTPRKRNGQEGFTLVELMIVVAIIGILAVLAIFGVSKYVTNAKTAEARNALGQIAKSAVAAYEQERSGNTLIAAGTPGLQASHQFCATAANPVPATLQVDRKYQSSTADWSGDALTGWVCLKFAMSEPQYFQYGYVGANGAGTGGFMGWAEANFSNGNAATNGYSLGGALSGSQVIVQPALEEKEGLADNSATKTVPAAP